MAIDTLNLERNEEGTEKEFMKEMKKLGMEWEGIYKKNRNGLSEELLEETRKGSGRKLRKQLKGNYDANRWNLRKKMGVE